MYNFPRQEWNRWYLWGHPPPNFHTQYPVTSKQECESLSKIDAWNVCDQRTECEDTRISNHDRRHRVLVTGGAAGIATAVAGEELTQDYYVIRII